MCAYNPPAKHSIDALSKFPKKLLIKMHKKPYLVLGSRV